MKKLSLEEFNIKCDAINKDRTKVKFVCPSCKHPQSMQDFIDKGIDRKTANNQIAFSCIGRTVKGLGCNWTLGGLLKIHEIVVVDSDLKEHPLFDFYEEKELEQNNESL